MSSCLAHYRGVVDVGFPRIDPVGPDGPALAAAVDVIATHVAPRAAEADLGGVRRETLDALAAAGLHGAPQPSPSAQRELAELLAGSDASTWFCWAQHLTPAQALQQASQPGGAHAAVQHRLLADATSGRLLCGVAFAHLRRPGPANPVAKRVRNGWVVDGTLDWVTSWDIADWFLLMVQDADSAQVVSAILPAGRGQVTGVLPGLVPGERLDLLAMSGTHTRPVRLDGVRIHDQDVLRVEDLERWRAQDQERTAQANPAVFGIARGALADLDLLADRRSSEQLRHACDSLVEEVRECRRQAYALADAGPGMGADATDRLRIRAQALRLAQQATTAVIVAQSGSATVRGCAAERRAREALFMHVQAQTGAAASAYLDVTLPDRARISVSR